MKGATRRRTAQVVAALMAAVISVQAGAVSANERTLLVEAIRLIGQADAEDGAAQEQALEAARERLQRIVDDHPDSATAKKILGDGVPVMGGTPISMAAINDRIRQSCLARPTQACLFDAALAAAKAARNDVYLLNEVALRQSEAGLIDDARITFAMGRERALAKFEQDDDGYKLGAIARGQAEAWMFEDAIETATLLGETNNRYSVSKDITEKLCEAGRLDDAADFVQSLPEKRHYGSKLVLDGPKLVLTREFARAGRLAEALAMARAEPDLYRKVMITASVGVGVHARGLPIDDLVNTILAEALADDVPALTLASAAQTFREAGIYDLAQVLMVKATALAASDKLFEDLSLSRLGEAQAALGMNAEAEATYARIKDPGTAVRLLQEMAVAHASRGTINEVITVCRSIGVRSPTSQLARDAIGHAVASCLSNTVEQFLKRDEPDKAITALEAIQRDFSQYKSDIVFVIKYYAEKGDFTSALRVVKKFEVNSALWTLIKAIAEARAAKVDEALETAQALTSPQDVALAYAAIATALPR